MIRPVDMLQDPCTTRFRHAVHLIELIDPVNRAMVVSVSCPGHLPQILGEPSWSDEGGTDGSGDQDTR